MVDWNRATGDSKAIIFQDVFAKLSYISHPLFIDRHDAHVLFCLPSIEKVRQLWTPAVPHIHTANSHRTRNKQKNKKIRINKANNSIIDVANFWNCSQREKSISIHGIFSQWIDNLFFIFFSLALSLSVPMWTYVVRMGVGQAAGTSSALSKIAVSKSAARIEQWMVEKRDIFWYENKKLKIAAGSGVKQTVAMRAHGMCNGDNWNEIDGRERIERCNWFGPWASGSGGVRTFCGRRWILFRYELCNQHLWDAERSHTFWFMPPRNGIPFARINKIEWIGTKCSCLNGPDVQPIWVQHECVLCAWACCHLPLACVLHKKKKYGRRF